MKDKVVKFLKFGYVPENVITYGIFFIVFMIYLFNVYWGGMSFSGDQLQSFKCKMYFFYFRHIQNIAVLLLIKLVLEYFVQNQRLLKRIASSNNIDDRDI